ncbi:hypothetical protein KAU45_05070, partial [bacterium]|nr:hypothetical protein [bacterium]
MSRENHPIYLEVALNLDLRQPLTYILPPGMRAEVGARVHVPLRSRSAMGFVVAISGEPPPGIDPASILGVK